MKNARPSGLDDHLGYHLRCLSNHVSRAFADRLAGHDVSVPQWVVLRSLFDRESAALHELAEALAVDNGALSRMVERLARKEWIAREADPADRRAVRLRLTEAGRALVPLLAREADANDAAFFGVIGETERRQLLAIVQALLAKHDQRGPALE